MNTVLSPPIPPYQNLPIKSGYYQPSRFVISGIQLGSTTIVITYIDNNYVIGQQVRIIIPSSFGTYQLNGISAYVISLPNIDQVELDIDSSRMNPFINGTTTTLPQIVAIGDINPGAISNMGLNMPNFIAGSFINISPQ